MPLRAVAEVNVAAIQRNTEHLRSLLRNHHGPGHHAAVCAVVKANGYGHGMLESARAALAGGARALAVATAVEAAELRDGGVQAPLIVMGAISAEELDEALRARAELVAWDARFLGQIRARLTAVPALAGLAPVRVHVKLDTGLGRLGTRSADVALALVRELTRSGPELELAGVMTHLATADDDHDFARRQLDAFRPFVAQARAIADTDIVAHAANSAAALLLPESRLDMVRLGIAIYGCDPLNLDPAAHGLEPALALRSYVAVVKPIAPGESAGYGRRFIATESSRIATLPIGYGDGLPRGLANNCDVLIKGRRHPLRGMVSMDNVTVDVGLDADVQVGDVATLIGTDGDERQLAEQLAGRLGTISYEILCGISARVPRHYHRDGEPL